MGRYVPLCDSLAAVVCVARTADACPKRIGCHSRSQSRASLVKHGKSQIDRLHNLIVTNGEVGIRKASHTRELGEAETHPWNADVDREIRSRRCSTLLYRVHHGSR